MRCFALITQLRFDYMLSFISKFTRSKTVALSISLVALSISTMADPFPGSLDRGFQLLYNLDFNRAQEQFASYQRQHVDDPMGPVAEAAGLLFFELNRLGVLKARFFDSDSSFQSPPMLKPDPILRDRLNSALQRAEVLAGPHLASDPNDRRALLAMTLVNGLKADYSALLENRSLVALHYTRDATNYARQLLAICGDCYDAYIATGISRYLIGSMSAPMRWILRMGGFSGDKQQGVPAFVICAIKESASDVRPEDSGPTSSVMAPTGRPPSRSVSISSIPVEETGRMTRGAGVSAEGIRSARAASI